MSLWYPFMITTPEERAAAREREIKQSYFEPGRSYTYQIDCCWYGGWFPTRVNDYTVYIKQAESPWMGVACEIFSYPTIIPGAKLVAYLRARKWAKSYMRRGGPPKGYW